MGGCWPAKGYRGGRSLSFALCIALFFEISGCGLWRGSIAEARENHPSRDAEGVYAVSDVSMQELAGETILDPGATPEFVRLLLEVAAEEIGNGEGPRGYTKYGDWAGNPYAEWCAEFVCWCVDQVDQRYGARLLRNVYPFYTGQNTGRDWFITRGRFVYRKGHCPGWGYQWLLGEDALMKKNDYIPRPGDLVFFSYNAAGDTEHVAIVEYCAMDGAGDVLIHVIEGNNPSRVQRNTFRLNNSQVLGFGACQDVVGTTMRGGNRGDKVRWLQESLHELGYLDARHITGTYGSHTKSAVAAFQRTLADKTANGIADIITQNSLRAVLYEKEYNSPDTWLVDE
ncbi:MAG: CHAP domain-containing protein [Clostridia bacterium]|nr:CHAP domain-containing protein [Clostridia bacterium]